MILHLAAGANVDKSIERPLDFVMDNTVASVNLMEFARKYHPNIDRYSIIDTIIIMIINNIHRFVYLSTAEVFGPAPQGITHKEYDRYNSGNPYAATKVSRYTTLLNCVSFNTCP